MSFAPSFAKSINTFRSGRRVFVTNHTIIDRIMASIAYNLYYDYPVFQYNYFPLTQAPKWIQTEVLDETRTHLFRSAVLAAVAPHIQDEIVKTRKIITGRGYQYLKLQGFRPYSEFSVVDPINSQGDQVFLTRKEMDVFIDNRISNAAQHIADIIEFDLEFEDMWRDPSSFDYEDEVDYSYE